MKTSWKDDGSIHTKCPCTSSEMLGLVGSFGSVATRRGVRGGTGDSNPQVRPPSLRDGIPTRGAAPWIEIHGYASDRRYATRGHGVCGDRVG